MSKVGMDLRDAEVVVDDEHRDHVDAATSGRTVSGSQAVKTAPGTVSHAVHGRASPRRDAASICVTAPPGVRSTATGSAPEA
jgi:hypothetical protein